MTDMTVDEFKSIFWWEWAHRLIARGIGVIFALPLLYFWLTWQGRRGGCAGRSVGILTLGGLQGAIGWWMVSSGLSVRTDVSQYRLGNASCHGLSDLRLLHVDHAGAFAALR